MQELVLRTCLTLAIGSLGASLVAQSDLEALGERARGKHPNPPRKVLAFYYPWYGNPNVQRGSGRWSHWRGVDEHNKQIASSTSYPLLGPYDSHDPKLVGQHCAWAKRSGVDGFIVSWWGQGTFEDHAMERLLAACREAGIKATIYYETVPAPRNARSATKDVLYILNRYGKNPAWLTVDGKPVVFVYGRAIAQIGLQGWLGAITQVSREHQGGVLFIGDRLNSDAARIFDGIHTYNTAGTLRGKGLRDVRAWAAESYGIWVERANTFGRISTITVIPGYDDTKIRKPGLKVKRFGGNLYRGQWEEAISAGPDWVLITSWNEWHEGSEIEPSVEHGEKYLELTAQFTGRFKSKAKGK